MVDRIQYPIYHFIQIIILDWLLISIIIFFNLLANILATRDILSELARWQPRYDVR